jgi:integrase
LFAAALLGADKPERPHIPRLRFQQFFLEHYLPFAKANKRSWRTDETLIRIHIAPAIGQRFLDEITRRSVTDLLAKLHEAGYGTGTTNRVLILIRYSLNLARDWGLAKLAVNPTARLRTVPDVQRERFLSDEETARLLAAIDEDQNRTAADAIKLLLLTGARRNEITHARWQDIDWNSNTLLVPISKTGKPRRIFLGPSAVEVLRALPRGSESPYLFASPITNRPSPSLHFPWTRIRKRAGLEGLRLHDLRHSFASFAVNGGVEIYTLQKLLGHSHVRATQRYAHLTEQKLADAAAAVGRKILSKN